MQQKHYTKKIIAYYAVVTLITILALLLYAQNTDFNTTPQSKSPSEIARQSLANNQKTEPKKLFLNTWRAVKNNYYDPTLNKQDWSRWKKRYVDKIQTEEDSYVAINSMLASLNDPYSRFLSPNEYKEQTSSIDSKLNGIGINITTVAGKIIVVNTLEGTPASKKDIKPGDLILTVDGTDVQGMGISSVATLIRGEIDTKVRLEILRDKRKFSVDIVREEIKIKNIKSKILDEDIGYIQILSFIGADASNEFLEAMNKTRDTKALIIDLRGNTGGLLPNALFIANLFIDNGNIVSIVDRNGIKTNMNAQRGMTMVDKPVVILIDQATASASEILSGALKDYKKAILVGEKTYGKGMIQRIIPMPNHTGMNLTIAKYLTPNGTDINQKGINPDFEVAYTQKDFLSNKDPQLDKAKSLLEPAIKH